MLGGDWRFPDEGQQHGSQKQKKAAAEGEAISDPVKDVVRRCLALEPAERPDVDELIALVEGVLSELPEDGSD